MAKAKSGKEQVEDFLLHLEHPFKAEIKKLRDIILKANTGLTEHIKWNAPSFRHHEEDYVTMRIHPPKQLQLIFHRGSKVKEQPKDKLINDPSGILSWAANDRAIATIKNMDDLQLKENDIRDLVNRWINAASLPA